MKDDVQHCASCGQIKPQHDGQNLPLTGRMMQVSRLATIGEMASGIAHELNQPLAAIVNYAQASVRMLGRPEPDMADIREAMAEIAAQAVRAGDIIRRMRNLVRSDAAERLRTQPNALIEEIAALLQADARVYHTELRLNLQPDVPEVFVNPIQIQHVLLNLARNAMEALQATPAGRREIVIGTVSAAADAVEIFVSDNGPGVSPAVADRLLEPFFTTKPAGTGLGLAISNTIVRAHDGQFGHRASLPGGACFYMQIPALTGEPS
jgi:two-component system sensor kinase FixL